MTDEVPHLRVLPPRFDPPADEEDVCVLEHDAEPGGELVWTEYVSGPCADLAFNGPACIALQVAACDAAAALAALEAEAEALGQLEERGDLEILDIADALDAHGVPYGYAVAQEFGEAPPAAEPGRAKLLRLVK